MSRWRSNTSANHRSQLVSCRACFTLKSTRDPTPSTRYAKDAGSLPEWSQTRKWFTAFRTDYAAQLDPPESCKLMCELSQILCLALAQFSWVSRDSLRRSSSDDDGLSIKSMKPWETFWLEPNYNSMPRYRSSARNCWGSPQCGKSIGGALGVETLCSVRILLSASTTRLHSREIDQNRWRRDVV